MPRKPPYRHPVRSHNRNGVRVKRYKRGKGRKSRKSSPIRGRASGFSLTIDYPGEASEIVNVSAGTYTGAVREGFKRTAIPKLPNRVVVRRL